MARTNPCAAECYAHVRPGQGCRTGRGALVGLHQVVDDDQPQARVLVEGDYFGAKIWRIHHVVHCLLRNATTQSVTCSA